MKIKSKVNTKLAILALMLTGCHIQNYGGQRPAVTVFAYQDKDFPTPLRSHTFACWHDGSDGFCISWYGEPRPGISRGRNLSFKETVNRAEKYGLTVYNVGTYDCETGFYWRADAHCKSLRGQSYHLIDVFSRGHAFNCIHAVSDASGVRLDTHALYGVSASEAIVKHFRKCGLTGGRNDASWKSARVHFLSEGGK